MAKSFKILKEKMTPEQREEVKQKSELILLQMKLDELRKKLKTLWWAMPTLQKNFRVWVLLLFDY